MQVIDFVPRILREQGSGYSTEPFNDEVWREGMELAPSSLAPEVSGFITPVVELTEELTPGEESERHRLELKVERAFYEAGAALRELRDKRLYRSTHKTFEQYCRERFRYNRSRSYQLIDAAAVVDNLSKCPQFVDKLPVNESQCRPLADLEPEEQCEAWGELLQQTGGDRPTGRAVKGIVDQKKAKSPTDVTDSYSKGQVFTLIGLSGQERKYNGCWAIATAVNNFTVDVEVYDAVLTVKPDNLNPIDSPAECQQVQAIAARIKRLRECELDRGAYPILESLKKHTYLTPLEEELLAFLEKRYLEASFDVR